MQRQSNFELLRIICMIFIIAHHYACHGGVYYSISEGNTLYTASMLMTLGKVGVDIFVLITGYFMVESTFKITRIVKLELAVLFYSIAWFIIAVNILKIETVSYLSVRDAILPSLVNKSSLYWFVPCYMGLQLLSPFINRLIAVINQKQFQLLLSIFGFFTCIVPSVLQSKPWYDGIMFLFVLLYLVGAYINKYGIHILKMNKITMCGLAIVLYLLMNFVTVSIKQDMTLYETYGINADNIWSGNSVLTIMISILIFCYFMKLNIKRSKVINCISSTTLGIYLIHDNIYFRSYFWKNIFHTENYYYSDMLWLHAIICIGCIFVICSTIEFVRSRVFDFLIYRLERHGFLKKVDGLLNLNE